MVLAFTKSYAASCYQTDFDGAMSSLQTQMRSDQNLTATGVYAINANYSFDAEAQ